MSQISNYMRISVMERGTKGGDNSPNRLKRWIEWDVSGYSISMQ